ncbi:ABC transporter ATP-binding protein [Halorubrum sp. DTA98]|uniref:ABC transporter ATP-binding protein n=1 Tax=Halorubrum sp. DTA98 TaxID=3402163 RepID=UPI003AAACBD8
MTAEPQLTVRNLEKRFEEGFTLSGIDFTVDTDEVVALLGPSGCGKTTVLRCVAGVETPESGEVVIDGELVQGDGTAVPPEGRNVGMVYQSYAIWPHKSVYENVVFPLEHNRTEFARSEHEARVDEVLELLRIRELKRAPATDLSGGQQQRVALARSLVHDPDLLLMDEPLSNLDRELRRNMRHELQKLQAELDVSILYVTHNQAEAFYLADRVLVMNDGRIVERGAPRELYSRPTARFTRQFVGEYNRFDGALDVGRDGSETVRSELVDFQLAKADHVSPSADLRHGTPVACFMRPDDIGIGRYAQHGGDVLELSGTVVGEGLLGDSYEITVGFEDGSELVLHTESYRQVHPGEEIHVHFDPSAIQVYPNTDT